MKMIGELMVFGYTTMKMRTFSKSVLLGILIRDWAEDVERNLTTVYPWEVSEGEWCWLTEKQAKASLPETGFGKPNKWKYWWYK